MYKWRVREFGLSYPETWEARAFLECHKQLNLINLIVNMSVEVTLRLSLDSTTF